MSDITPGQLAVTLAATERDRDAWRSEVDVLRAHVVKLDRALIDAYTRATTWHDRYNRDVEGLNNEGDPIGGNPPEGLRQRVEQLQAERDEARAFAENACEQYNDLLATKRQVTCVYCGHVYPDGTPASQDTALTAHIMTCGKHPIHAQRARADRAVELLLEARPIIALCRDRLSNDGYSCPGDTSDVDALLERMDALAEEARRG